MMAWCDGFAPIGNNNLRTLPDVGPALYTAPGEGQISFFAFGNLGANPICMVFLRDGSIVQVSSATGIQTAVAPAGTITTSQIGIGQYGNQYIIIVANQLNGYFLWDGTTLSRAGTLSTQAEVLYGGIGYTEVPGVTAFGGSGSGASFTATVANGNVVGISVDNPGSGYTQNDAIYLAFSGGVPSGAYGTAYGTTTIVDGKVTAYTVANSGAGYTSSAVVSFQGGGGSGATGTVTVVGFLVTGIVITNGGSGYTSPPTAVITDVNNHVAQARVAITAFGVQGTSVETYAGRVWVADGDKVFVSSPGSASNFAGDAAAVFTSNDPFLRVGYQSLKQSNGFLYLLGDSSINYISGVQVSGSPAITTFNNQNVDPQIGTPYPNSVQVFSRNIVFANDFGVHVSYGGAVTKISQALDGVYNSAGPNFGGLAPSGAVAAIFGIQVYVVLVRIIGPISGQITNKMFLWDGKKWWASRQTPNLIYITSQEINSQLTAYGTDGMSIYPLFQQPSDTFAKIVQSKLWSVPSYMYTKTAHTVYGVVQYYLADNPEIDIAIDNENSSLNYSVSVTANVVVWTNNTSQVVVWTNDTAQVVTWYAAGLVVFGPQVVSQTGRMTGLSIATAAKDVALVSATLVDQVYQFNI